VATVAVRQGCRQRAMVAAQATARKCRQGLAGTQSASAAQPEFVLAFQMLKASNSTATSPNNSTANATGSRSSQIRMIMLPARNHGLTDSMTDGQNGSLIFIACYRGVAFRQHSAANGCIILELQR
jgi:hypothetical protein